MSNEPKTSIGISELNSRFVTKSKIKRATLYESLVPMYHISKVFGLTCVSKELVSGSLRFRESRSGTVINALWMAAVISLGLISSSHMYQMNSAFMSKLSAILSLISLYSVIALSVCCLFGARSQKELISSVTSLNLIDEALTSLDIRVPHEQNRHFIIKFLVSSIFALSIWYIFIFVLILYDTFIFSDLHVSSLIVNMIIWFGYLIPELLNLLVECQILLWILGIKQRFKLLNKKLNQITDIKDVVLVQNISAIHADLCRVSRRANAINSLQLLFVILSHFLNILIAVYSGVLIHIMETKKGGGLMDHETGAIFISYWLIWYLAKIVVLCKYCGETKIEQNQATGVLVHRALGRTTNPQVQKQLLTFSSQLVHSKASFTASEFFDVDLKLLAPMAGSVATYLIILVQFEMARHKGETPDCRASSVAVNGTA